jgi:hypothetical protein
MIQLPASSPTNNQKTVEKVGEIELIFTRGIKFLRKDQRHMQLLSYVQNQPKKGERMYYNVSIWQ